MNTLIHNDLRYVAQRLPQDIRAMLSANAGHVYVGGGFIRATIAGEEPSDIDVFGDSAERLDLLARDMQVARPGSRLHKTKNAITLITPNRLPVQFITRWVFGEAGALVRSFDFTVCQAAVWRSGPRPNDPWRSACGEGFYIDLAGRRLVYTNPVRDEEAGGSMLRVLKYVKRGYSIQVASLGDVIARLADKVDAERAQSKFVSTGQVIGGLLREVDPLLVVDGIEVVDDHEPEPGETV